MPTRLRFVFDGGPDDDSRLLREVTDGRGKTRSFGHLARWYLVSEKQNMWALETHAVNLDRRPIVALITLAHSEIVDDVIAQLNDNGSIVLNRNRDLVDVLTFDDDTMQREQDLQRQRIDLADSVFVVNEHGNIDIELHSDILYAEEQEKRVQYLRYDVDVTLDRMENQHG